MKKEKNKFLCGSVLGLAAASGLLSTPATASDIDISAAAGISNMYLYRGLDLGAGDAMLFGSVTASMNGLYGTLAAESGDNVSGNEWDLYLGYGGTYNDFSFDMHVASFYYPANNNFDTFGTFSELSVNLMYMGFNLGVKDNIAGNSGNRYFSVAYTIDKFTMHLGMSDSKQPSRNTVLSVNPSDANYAGKVAVDYTHLDLTYQHDKRLSFTVSKIINQDSIKVGTVSFDKNLPDDTLVQVMYSLPVDL